MSELKTLLSLIDSFSKLPGIGTKSAERMAYAVLEMKKDDIDQFAKALIDSKNNIHKCKICGLYSEEEVCPICQDKTLDHSTCIVLAYPKDILPFEKMNSFKGVYHCLGGLISPNKGIGPDDLNIASLLNRIKTEGIKEIIIATSPTLEGETTSLYLSKILENENVVVTRLAYGLPMGASIDYADTLTLSKAIEGRKKL